MCRLIAIIGKSENTALLLEQFQMLAHNGQVPGVSLGHKDGWGIVGYQKGKMTVCERDQDDAFKNEKYSRAVKKVLKVKSDFIIGHLRKASVGKNKIENTHPFIFKNISFAQNGTVFQSEKISLQPKFLKQVHGTSDSERLFYFILQDADKFKSDAVRQSIMRSTKIIRQQFDYTAMNFLVSDGARLWALREVNEKNNIVREKKLIQYYTLFIGVEKKAETTILSSEKIIMPGIKWKALKNHEMLEVVAKNGEIKSYLL